jgi:tRNA/rRNA methyltransferase
VSNPLDNIRIVLVSPIYGGNVGAVCRAMQNMGLSDLAVAAPRDHIDLEEACMMACWATDLLESRKEYATAADAVAECGLVAGTTARVGLYRDHARTPREWAPRLLETAATTKVAVLFGPEDKGLCNEDLALCTQIVQIPSTKEYTSINLAQAVMICCYELYVASDQFEPSSEKSPEAPSHLRERMFAAWREALLATGFMEEEKSDHMMLGLRRILSRGTLTENDVKILMGMARQSEWCARELEKARGRDAEAP